MKMTYDRSTAEGQKRLFYEVAAGISKRNEAIMDSLAYDIGWKDGNEGKPRNSPHRQYALDSLLYLATLALWAVVVFLAYLAC